MGKEVGRKRQERRKKRIRRLLPFVDNLIIFYPSFFILGIWKKK